MFTVEYVDSVDPLIGIVQTDPSAIFAKPHMGYLLFLFGEADPEVADWIRQYLRALDSLLGPDIAGAVFVKSFETRALVRSYYTRQWDPPRKIRDGKVDLSEINYVESTAVASPMLNDQHDPSMEAQRSFEDLTATTYASDEVARALGLLAELPCIVFLDAIPGPMRCHRLQAENLSDALSIVRGVVGKLVADSRFDEYRSLLVSAHDAGAKISVLRHAAASNDQLGRDNLRLLRNPMIPQLRAALDSLLEGSARRFRHAVWQVSLPTDAIEQARARASMYAARLTHVCRTIRGVDFYLKMEWPISAPDHARLAALIANHVAAVLDVVALPTDQFNKSVILDVAEALKGVRAEVIAEIWGDLPTVADLERQYTASVLRVKETAQAERERLASDIEHLSAQLDCTVREMGAAPRITEAFDAVAARSMRPRREMDVGPEMVERLLQALTNGAVKFVGRDIYIGTNVAAMGPFATSNDARFG